MQRDEEGPQHCCRHSQFSLFSSIFTFSQIFSSSFTCPTFSPKFSLFLTFSPFTCEYISPCSYPIKCLLLRKRLVAEERLQRRRAREEAQCFSPFMFGSIIWKNHFLPDSDSTCIFSFSSPNQLLHLLPPEKNSLNPESQLAAGGSTASKNSKNASRLKPTQTQNEQTSGWTTDLHNLVPSHFCASILKQLGLMLLQVDEAVGFRSVR